MAASKPLGKIERVDPTDIWPNEARDFTPWLAEHIADLGEALGLDLEWQSTEAPVGPFALDILAREAGRERPVIIENQLKVTDHSHLGQVLTYASGYDANVVVWIAKEFRDEHREALNWLNRRTVDESAFFGVAIEVWTINGSPPAPHFRVIAAPSGWRPDRNSGTANGEISGRDRRYQAFFQVVVDSLREQHTFTQKRKAQPRSWQSFSAGLRGFTFGAHFAQGGRATVALYVNNGDRDWNTWMFDELETERESIESELGALEWERLDNRQSCRIAAIRPGSIDGTPKSLDEVKEWMIGKLLAFKASFPTRLSELVEQRRMEPDQRLETDATDASVE